MFLYAESIIHTVNMGNERGLGKKDTALFGAGLCAPFISLASGAAVSALLPILVGLGAIGIIIAALISILDGFDEIMELIRHLVRLEIPFIIGFSISTMVLLGSI